MFKLLIDQEVFAIVNDNDIYGLLRDEYLEKNLGYFFMKILYTVEHIWKGRRNEK